METIQLILVVFSIFGFGFFLGYERIGSGWSSAAALIMLLIAAFNSAWAEADQTSVEWQLIFNVLVFNSFALGYQVGYPRKRPWWKRVVVVMASMTLFCFVYLLFVV